jgi:hypothetical protein
MHRRLSNQETNVETNVETNNETKLLHFFASPDPATTSIFSAMISFYSTIHALFMYIDVIPSSSLLIE